MVVTNGTDVPVERIDPIPSFWGSVARKTSDGSVFPPEQRVTREEGLRAYTLNNAYAAFEEQEQGSITVGKLADLVVVGRDLRTTPPAELVDVKIERTMVGGRWVYES